MAINLNDLATGLVNTVDELVGSQLSTIGSGVNTANSVFIARSQPPKPRFPYAVVDYIGRAREGRSLTNEYLNPTTEATVYETRYVYTFTVDIHSDELGSATIAQELEARLFTDQGLNSIRDNTTFELRAVENVPFASTFLNTNYEEVSSLRVLIAVRDVLEDTTTGIITTIRQEGDLYPHEIGEGTPLEVDVTAP